MLECWSVGSALERFWSAGVLVARWSVWSAGALECWWRVGALVERWSVFGVLECWSVGAFMECWSVGEVEHFCSVGEVECWSIGAFERWSVGVFKRLSDGAFLERRSIGACFGALECFWCVRGEELEWTRKSSRVESELASSRLLLPAVRADVKLNRKNVTHKNCFSHAGSTFCVLLLSHNKRYGFRGALLPIVGGFGGFAGRWVGGRRRLVKMFVTHNIAPTEAINMILCVTYVRTIATPAIIDELTNSSRTNEPNKKNVPERAEQEFLRS